MGGLKVLALALVLEGEKALLPDVRPSLAPGALGPPRSKVKNSPFGSISAGLGCPTSSQRSRKCCWAADRSVSWTFFHLVIKVEASIVGESHEVRGIHPSPTTIAHREGAVDVP